MLRVCLAAFILVAISCSAPGTGKPSSGGASEAATIPWKKAVDFIKAGRVRVLACSHKGSCSLKLDDNTFVDIKDAPPDAWAFVQKHAPNAKEILYASE